MARGVCGTEAAWEASAGTNADDSEWRVYRVGTVPAPGANEADVQATFSFAFIYGMLPAAPTVVVFAREYGEPSELLAALQLLCLLLSAPFLLVTTLAIESPTNVQPAAMFELSYWVAILGAVLSLSLAAFLVATQQRITSPSTLSQLILSDSVVGVARRWKDPDRQ